MHFQDKMTPLLFLKIVVFRSESDDSKTCYISLKDQIEDKTQVMNTNYQYINQCIFLKLIRLDQQIHPAVIISSWLTSPIRL